MSFEATGFEKSTNKYPTERWYCKHCMIETEHTVEQFDSSCGGYEDYKYTCITCKHGFWIDGPDS